MKTTINEVIFINIEEMFREVQYYMGYMKDTVLGVLEGGISLDEMEKTSQDMYNIALQESQARDKLYESGAMGRLAISEGGPNDIQYFIPERDRCIEILKQLGIKI